MKKNLILIIFILVSGILFYGCSSTVETTTIYLQELEVTGPINQSPVHLTDSSESPSITFSPKFLYSTKNTVNGKVSGHSSVNQDGVFQVDTIFNSDGTINHFENATEANRYPYNKNNLTWDIPSVSVGVDVDIKLTGSFALFGGVKYSSGNNRSLLGGNFGLGLFGVSKKGLAFRLDAGAQFQSIYYDAYTIEDVRITGFGAQEYVILYHDTDINTPLNPFITLTINSCNKDWLFNFFINLGYCWQTLADFEPQEPDEDYYGNYFDPDYYSYREIVYDKRGETTYGFAQITPGITIDLTDNSRLLLGTGLYILTDMDAASTTFFILPMMQFDFSL